MGMLLPHEICLVIRNDHECKLMHPRVFVSVRHAWRGGSPILISDGLVLCVAILSSMNVSIMSYWRGCACM